MHKLIAKLRSSGARVEPGRDSWGLTESDSGIYKYFFQLSTTQWKCMSWMYFRDQMEASPDHHHPSQETFGVFETNSRIETKQPLEVLALKLKTHVKFSCSNCGWKKASGHNKVPTRKGGLPLCLCPIRLISSGKLFDFASRFA